MKDGFVPFSLLLNRTETVATQASAASNFIALIPSRFIRQMLANVFGVEFRRDCMKGQEKKK